MARWDGGSRDEGKKQKEDLDVDVEGVSKRQQHRFERGQGGYSGHRSKKLPSATGRGYEVSISTLDGRIFEAIVSFAVHRKIAFSAQSVAFSGALDPQIVRAEN